MLKIFTIYSMVLIIYSMILCICKIIKSDAVEESIISSLLIVLYCPMIYVLVEMLKMLSEDLKYEGRIGKIII